MSSNVFKLNKKDNINIIITDHWAIEHFRVFCKGCSVYNFVAAFVVNSIPIYRTIFYWPFSYTLTIGLRTSCHAEQAHKLTTAESMFSRTRSVLFRFQSSNFLWSYLVWPKSFKELMSWDLLIWSLREIIMNPCW